MKISGKRLTTKAGLHLHLDNNNGDELSHVKNRRETLNSLALGDVQEANAGIYVDASLEIAPRWKINAGLLYDQFHFSYLNNLDNIFNQKAQDKVTLSPKLNLFFVASKTVRFYANSGIGSHSNDSRVVVAQEGHELLQKAYGIEFGTLLNPVPSLLINAYIWRMNLKHEFVYVGDAAEVEPSGRTKRKGIDLTVRWQIMRGLYAHADFNYTRPRSKEEPEGKNFIPLAPTLTTIGGLTAWAKNGLFSLRYRHIGDQPANEGNSTIAVGQLVVDAMLGLKKGNTKQLFPCKMQFRHRRWLTFQSAGRVKLRILVFPFQQVLH